MKINKEFFYKYGLIFFLSIFLVSCGTSSKVRYRRNRVSYSPSKKNENLRTLKSNYKGNVSENIQSLLASAEKYIGKPYQYAGIGNSGFDCSGLMCRIFSDNEINLPRRSKDQALEGMEISIEEVKPGDLVFFATMGGKNVSHVGLVYEIQDNQVRFIHSSTSKGVMISSLSDPYWNKAYLFTRRIVHD